jgi:hypothetical protein
VKGAVKRVGRLSADYDPICYEKKPDLNVRHLFKEEPDIVKKLSPGGADLGSML